MWRGRGGIGAAERDHRRSPTGPPAPWGSTCSSGSRLCRHPLPNTRWSSMARIPRRRRAARHRSHSRRFHRIRSCTYRGAPTDMQTSGTAGCWCTGRRSRVQTERRPLVPAAPVPWTSLVRALPPVPWTAHLHPPPICSSAQHHTMVVRPTTVRTPRLHTTPGRGTALHISRSQSARTHRHRSPVQAVPGHRRRHPDLRGIHRRSGHSTGRCPSLHPGFDRPRRSGTSNSCRAVHRGMLGASGRSRVKLGRWSRRRRQQRRCESACFCFCAYRSRHRRPHSRFR
eukprot:SAG11_NODE_568_length_8478_cov_24.289891_3_plen_284_part_00